MISKLIDEIYWDEIEGHLRELYPEDRVPIHFHEDGVINIDALLSNNLLEDNAESYMSIPEVVEEIGKEPSFLKSYLVMLTDPMFHFPLFQLKSNLTPPLQDLILDFKDKTYKINNLERLYQVYVSFKSYNLSPFTQQPEENKIKLVKDMLRKMESILYT